MKKALFLCLSALCCVSCAKSPNVNSAADSSAAKDDAIQLIVWNDFHSTLYETKSKDDPNVTYGGLPVWMAAVEALKGDGLSLVLDAGDMFQGATPLNELEGMGAVEIMSAVGVEASTFGNHEFDYYTSEAQPDNPQGALSDAMAAASFEWVNANISVTSDDYPNWPPKKGLKPYKIIEKGPYRIAVTGVSTLDTPVTTNSLSMEGLRFENPELALARIIPEIVAENPDFIIVLGHLTGEPKPAPEFGQISTDATFDNEIGQILALPEDIRNHIDLLVTGHLHISFMYDNGHTFITQGTAGGRELTTMKLVPKKDGKGLELDRSSVSKIILEHAPIYKGCGGGYDHVESLAVGPLTLKPDERAYEMTSRFENSMKEGLCDVMACAAEPITREGNGDTAAGNLVVDAQRSAFPEADGAILNAGGLRIDWPAGDLYRELISAMMPFDNRAFLVEMTGQELIDAIKITTSGHFHGPMQVSGITYTYQPGCERDTEDVNHDGTVEYWEKSCLCDGVTINGKPVDPKKSYKIVISDFLFNGGDSLAGIFKTSKLLSEGPVIKKTIMSYVSGHEGCYSTAELVDEANRRVTAGVCSAFAK